MNEWVQFFASVGIASLSMLIGVGIAEVCWHILPWNRHDK